MADSAYLKQSNTSCGLSLLAGGTFTLPRLVGLAQAIEIVMLDKHPGRASAGIRPVNRVMPPAPLLGEAERLAARAA